MKKCLLCALTVVLLAGCRQNQPVSPSPTPQVQTEPSATPSSSLSDAIKAQLATKYNKPADTINITVSQESEGFAKGMVGFTDEPGGAIWFAALVKLNWMLVADGQGPVACDQADKYSFPASLIPECLQNDTLVKR